MKDLIGATVNKIYINEDTLVFDTNKGMLAYEVTGDCCSHSYFYDFQKPEYLINGDPRMVVDVKEVELVEGDYNWVPYTSDERKAKGLQAEDDYSDCVACYGYQIVTVNQEWGEVTSVFSFRNDSNGYYGGSLSKVSVPSDLSNLTEITTDYVKN